ncbi:hypothetical protein [Flavobacterium sp. 3HN19-14]|uniref:hypothetical protein n=1 Tax=Flavobacterium sp. 3HN19-14 TaxID=3448133 RepID=UPI003EE25C32
MDFSGANGSGTYRGTVNGFGQLRVIGSLLSGSSAVLVPNGTYRIGRYRLTNTVPWTPSSNAQFWVNNVTTNGSTAPYVTGYKNGTTFNSYPYGLATPVATPGVTVGYSEGAPLPLTLNVCATSGAAVNLGAVTCFGGNNGSATISLSPVPSNLSVNYSIDGGASTPVVLTSSGEFNVSGLTVGSHTVTVTGNSPCTAPFDVVFTIS